MADKHRQLIQECYVITYLLWATLKSCIPWCRQPTWWSSWRACTHLASWTRRWATTAEALSLVGRGVGRRRYESMGSASSCWPALPTILFQSEWTGAIETSGPPTGTSASTALLAILRSETTSAPQLTSKIHHQGRLILDSDPYTRIRALPSCTFSFMRHIRSWSFPANFTMYARWEDYFRLRISSAKFITVGWSLTHPSSRSIDLFLCPLSNTRTIWPMSKSSIHVHWEGSGSSWNPQV